MTVYILAPFILLLVILPFVLFGVRADSKKHKNLQKNLRNDLELVRKTVSTNGENLRLLEPSLSESQIRKGVEESHRILEGMAINRRDSKEVAKRDKGVAIKKRMLAMDRMIGSFIWGGVSFVVGLALVEYAERVGKLSAMGSMSIEEKLGIAAMLLGVWTVVRGLYNLFGEDCDMNYFCPLCHYTINLWFIPSSHGIKFNCPHCKREIIS